MRDDVLRLLAAESPVPDLKRYYFTEDSVRGEATGMVCGGLAEVFLEVLQAPPLLAICGGGPVGQALASAGALGGFDLLVVEDREEFARAELFPAGTQIERVDRRYGADFLPLAATSTWRSSPGAGKPTSRRSPRSCVSRRRRSATWD